MDHRDISSNLKCVPVAKSRKYKVTTSLAYILDEKGSYSVLGVSNIQWHPSI